MRGKPDGRGEWTADDGGSYVGDWRAGVQHGYGKEIIYDDFTYSGGFSGGLWHEKGVTVDGDNNMVSWGSWVHGCEFSGCDMTHDGQITFLGTREFRDGPQDSYMW
jgi:hypothetical protein